MFGWPQKSGSISGFACAWEYWWLGLMDFRNFFITYVFGVRESIFHSFTELPCSDDFENLGQLPVLQVLKGSDDLVLWIFVIPSLPTFSGSRNLFFIVSRSYPVWMTSKNPGQLPVLQVLESTADWVLWIFVISSLPTFSASRNPFFIVSRSYPN